MEKIRVVQRGEIYDCSFSEGTGSEQHKDRPVLIIQNDTGNKFSPTTIVAVISSQKYPSQYPMHTDLVGVLSENSTIMFEQVFTVDKSRLKNKLADISKNKTLMDRVNNSIKVSLGV